MKNDYPELLKHPPPRREIMYCRTYYLVLLIDKYVTLIKRRRKYE